MSYKQSTSSLEEGKRKEEYMNERSGQQIDCKNERKD
jgi:hypothetical protein